MHAYTYLLPSLILLLTAELICFIPIECSIFRSSCRRDALFKLVQRGKVLTGGKITLNTASTLSMCARACTSEPQCLSFNYISPDGAMPLNNCEVMNVNKSSNGTSFVDKAGWKYYEPVVQIGPRCRNKPCQKGYACLESCNTTEGFECVDEDECTDGGHNCDSNATCTNNAGSFSCACNPGYLGNGSSCSDGDECTDGGHNCDSNATCTNNAGSFSCACNPGYLGNGSSCSASCRGNGNALGISSNIRSIPDSAMTASSTWGNHATLMPYIARLNNKINYAAWIPSDSFPSNQYLQIDLSKDHVITGAATQGRHGERQWVKSYQLQYLKDGSATWIYYQINGATKTFQGNSDCCTVVKHNLNNPFTARTVRFYPKTYYVCRAMRVELYGCNIEAPVKFNTLGHSGKTGAIQTYVIPLTGMYNITGAGARGGKHTTNYGDYPGTFDGGRGAIMKGTFHLLKGAILKIVTGQKGGNSVEVKDGQTTTQTATSLGLSIEDNAGTGGGGGSFVYTSSNLLLIAAGGGGGSSAGWNGIDGQSGESGTKSVGKEEGKRGTGGTNGQPGQCCSSGNYHGGVGAGWKGQGHSRASNLHGERGGSKEQIWVGGKAGAMNSGNNGGPSPGAVGGFGGGGGGSDDNGASGGGGGYSGGGAGSHPNQAGGGGGSYCSGGNCSGVTGGNPKSDGHVIIQLIKGTKTY